MIRPSLAAPTSVTPVRSGMQVQGPQVTMTISQGRELDNDELGRARRHYEALAQLVDAKRDRRIAVAALRDISNCISAREAIAVANDALASLLLSDD